MNTTSVFFSVALFIVLFALLLPDTSNDQITGTHHALISSVSDSRESSERILEESEKDILFIENLGQITDTEGRKRPDILFLTRSEGVDMYLTKSGMTYVFSKRESDVDDQLQPSPVANETAQARSSYYRLDMEFVGANKDITIRKALDVDQQFHYYTPDYPDGLSPKAYKKIKIENLYDGIDLVYYEKEGRMKYDFILKAGADAGRIKMKYEGAESMKIDEEGNVVITTPMGEIREEKPYTYSRSTGREIGSRYRLENNTVAFDVSEFATSEDFIIDPVRVWATYYGGNDGDRPRSICTDNDGNLYVTGRTESTDFPTQSLAGSYNQMANGGNRDAFILKFNSDGVRLWGTYYGGSDRDEGNSICTDNLNNVYVAGETESTDFPTQSLAGAYNQTSSGDTMEVFILKFDNNGVRQWATYYGGNDLDRGFDVCTDNSNNLYVSGETHSTDFPIQSLAGAYNQTTSAGWSDLFILKFDSNGARQWATYYGGSGYDGRYGSFWYSVGGMCTDGSGNLYVTGSTISSDFPLQSSPGAYYQSTLVGNYTDAFILKFDSNGARQWATYYGGSVYDGGCGMVTDNSGDLYVTGYTYSHADFPTQTLPGAYNQSFTGGSEVFILRFDNNGVRLWATCYGGVGTNNEIGHDMAIDNSGNIYITGEAQQGQFESQLPLQTLPGAYNQSTHGGVNDAFVLMFDSNGARKWATYYGGNNIDRAWGCCTDNSGNFYTTGNTLSDDFPLQTLPGAYNQTGHVGNDVFIVGFNEIYCNSGGLNFDHVYISDVAIGDLSNSSSGSDYSDFTLLTMNAIQNASYPVTLSFWKDHGSHKADWRVWIDFNIDGDFDDAGELVFSADNKPNTVEGTITIPSNTSVGMTRMRVAMRDGDGGFGPCDIHSWGEVEDYSVDLQPGIPQPPVADFEGSPATVTVGNSVNFTDLSLNDPTLWDWSFAGGTPSSSTQQNPTVTYNTEGVYTVSLTATNPDGSDTEMKLDYITVVEAGCTSVSNSFPDDPLTHSGVGSSSTSFDFGTPGHTDVSFVVSEIDAKINGNPSNRYIELVTVEYTDDVGIQSYGTFSGENTSLVNVNLAGPVYSVTVTLEDGYDGDPPGTLSVDLSSISSCPPPAGAMLVSTDIPGENLHSNISDLLVYPNPTRDMLTIRYQLNTTSEITMRITDINGVPVQGMHFLMSADIHEHHINASRIPAGVYFLHLGSEGQMITRKFVVLR